MYLQTLIQSDRSVCNPKSLTVDTYTVQLHILGYKELIFQDITEGAQMFTNSE